MKSIPLILLFCVSLGQAETTIPASDSRLQILGTHYINKTDTGLQFQRHSEETLNIPRKQLGVNPAKARNNSGIVIAFETDSTSIRIPFKIITANYMGARFGVFENGKLIHNEKFRAKEKSAVLEFETQQPGNSLIEVVLPSFASVEFQALVIDDDANLAAPSSRPLKIYVALGDSISHGVGQDGASHLTWPYLLSKKLDAELFNLAVGGGKISVPIGLMLQDWEHIDLITILIGYNDLHFAGKTPEIYREKYNELLEAIRSNHPETKIVCITPLYTKKPISKKTSHTIDEFRTELSTLIKRKQSQDKNLFIIKGDEISSEANLREDNPKDPVHLGIHGARLLSDALFQRISDK